MCGCLCVRVCVCVCVCVSLFEASFFRLEPQGIYFFWGFPPKQRSPWLLTPQEQRLADRIAPPSLSTLAKLSASCADAPVPGRFGTSGVATRHIALTLSLTVPGILTLE